MTASRKKYYSSMISGFTFITLSACAAGEIELPIAVRIANATPAVSVTARGETTPVGTTNADAADDPEQHHETALGETPTLEFRLVA